MAVALDDRERAMLAGEAGDGAALAMRLVLVAAEALGAERLIPITRAHVDSCLYHGQATLDFVRRLQEGGARVSVPTTLNVGAVDLLHPELWRGDPETAARGRELMEAYRSLGCRPTFTCAPYQLADARPGLGEQVAWAESNAIVFCNSVLGARTERYGDFTDIACAITGRVPDAGLHRTDARRAVLVLRPAADIPVALLHDDAFYPVLGVLLGERAGSRVAALDGLPTALSEDRLKAVGAAAASSGAVAIFHAVGSTPEAPTLEAALQGGAADEVAEYGMAELRAIAAELAGAPVADGVELLVSTSRDVLETAEHEGVARRLREAGAELLVDTCSYLGPILRPTPLPVMTDSGKWAWYAPANIGARVVFASRRECLRSAVGGLLWRDDRLWGDA